MPQYGEHWEDVMKNIPGYDGYYATDEGQIISTRSGQARILSQRIHKGYLHVQIRKGIGRSTKIKTPVHQLILLAFKGNKLSPELMCRHLNGKATDNRPDNLEWGTAKENQLDAISHGTAVCLRLGERHPASKLLEQDVYNIINLLNQGYRQVDIATIYGITQRHVSDIKLGRTWKHLCIPRGA
jgi:hypothetical protein